MGEGVIVTQVVPDFKSDLPGVVEYRQAMKQYMPEMAPGFVSLEGYIVAKICVEGLNKAGTELTRESVIDGLLSLTRLDVGIGESLHYKAGEHQGSHKVWPTIIRGGKYVPFDWAELKK